MPVKDEIAQTDVFHFDYRLGDQEIERRTSITHNLRGADESALQGSGAGIDHGSLRESHHRMGFTEDDADIFPVAHVPCIVFKPAGRGGGNDEAVV